MHRADTIQTQDADEATSDAPDTIPDTNQDGELLEALEWLKKAGIVSVDNKPPFASFFDEAVERKAS